MTKNRIWLRELVCSILKPGGVIRPVDWVEANVVLAGEVSIAGPVSFRDFAYQRSFVDAFADDRYTDLAIMGAPQVAKSTAVMCGLIHQLNWNPRDALWVTTTESNARSFSETRWQTTLRATPAMAALLPSNTDKIKNLEQQLIGATINFTGSNSLGNVAQRTKSIVILDEIDKVEDRRIITQADARALSAAPPKRVKMSEPQHDGGPIHTAWLAGDRREWHICCVRCGGHFLPDLAMLRWSEDARTEDGWNEVLVEQSTELICPLCQQGNTESSRVASIREGVEVKSAVGAPGHASWRWPAWLAPWPAAAWGKLAVQLARARIAGNMVEIDNKVRAVPVKFSGERLDPKDLRARCYKFKGYPENGWLLTAGVDTQDNRLEVQFVVWGDSREAWVVEYAVIHGDPELDETWDELARYLWGQARPLPLSAVFVDSGGHHTEKVYRFCGAHAKRRVFACRGSSHPGRTVVSRPRRTRQYKVKLYTLGVDTAKAYLMSAFRRAEGKPGCVHFREDLDDEYFKQLAAEELQERRTKGRTAKWWVKVYENNEALDTFVYAYAALILLGDERAIASAKRRVLDERKNTKEAVAVEVPPMQERQAKAEPPAPIKKTGNLARRIAPRRSGWVNSF